MTAFAASLFALGAMMSVWVMGTSWKRYGRDALAVRGKLAACPETFMLRWKLIERVTVPALAAPRRSDERRVGHECVSPCRSRWSPSPHNNHPAHHTHTTQ